MALQMSSTPMIIFRQLQGVLQIGRWRSLRRTALPQTTAKKGADYPVTPIVLGFFVFVVIGSCELFPLFNFNITVNLSFIVEFFRADLEHRPSLGILKLYRLEFRSR
ncbi:hypothetical protein IFM89_004621 [Coptis chinensis]|uniref:Uncharacterized protein n=1 Tax=Coptis chinensis TaxID=261450 RepID=A0A835H4L0_9MAGN|nr:hypothetical protein IFM89_004621 [Coptis chinensis]